MIDSQSGQGKSISFECKSLQFMSHEFCLMSQMFYVMYQCGVLSFFYRCASFILNGLQYPFVVGLDMEQIFCYIERKALPE